MKLAAENKELKEKLAKYEAMRKEANKDADVVEDAKKELTEALETTHEMQDRYNNLLKEMQNFKKTVKGRNAVERWAFDLKKK